MRVVLVGSATIDVVDGDVRVGGSVYYGGLALSKYLHDEAHAVTLVDECSASLILKSFSSVGVVPHLVRCGKVPHFTISGGKVVDVVAGECRIPADVVEGVLEEVRPDILVVAPVYREIEISGYLRLLGGLSQVKVKSLDIQGLVRSVGDGSIECVWSNELFKMMGLVNLTHGNLKEFCFSGGEEAVVKQLLENESLRGSAVAVTMDSRGLYLVADGKVFEISSLKVVGADEVGAGDVFTAVASHYMAAGEDLLEAVVRGVVAASLKVSRAAGDWFNVEELRERFSEVVVRQHVIKT